MEKITDLPKYILRLIPYIMFGNLVTSSAKLFGKLSELEAS